MKTLWIEKKFAYDGSQLKSLFAYLEHGTQGDSIVAWQGPCDIPFEHMVDGEDFLERSAIRSGQMVHFIVEKFRENLFAGVLMQRLLASLCFDLLCKRVPAEAQKITRSGDDIYWGKKKFSISIATVSPVSTLVHFAVNVTNDNTPVETCALSDFGIDPKGFACDLIGAFAEEIQTSEVACQKVHWVK